MFERRMAAFSQFYSPFVGFLNTRLSYRIGTPKGGDPNLAALFLKPAGTRLPLKGGEFVLFDFLCRLSCPGVCTLCCRSIGGCLLFAWRKARVGGGEGGVGEGWRAMSATTTAKGQPTYSCCPLLPSKSFNLISPICFETPWNRRLL